MYVPGIGEVPTEMIIYGGVVIAVTGILAFLYKKYTETVKMFLEEKLTYLEWTIKLIEEILPYLPDDVKKKVTTYLGFLKWWKAVNEALLGVSPTSSFKLWKQYKARGVNVATGVQHA